MAAEKKELSRAEVRRTVASSLGAAFGFVIGLVWANVVMGGFATGGINLTNPAHIGDWGGWAIFVVVALVVTMFMVIMIILFSRWSSKE